ncbi:MAG TPA: septum formation initiator family protein [Candidatus Paceibacterota bacterium]|nr:septum formation initiator family protein [Candidatus Paceibacterota bacterium]
MREFRERKKIKKRIYSKTVVIILAILLALLIEGTWKVFQKERESAANLWRVNNQLSELQARNTALSDDVAALQTDQGIESEIRSKYQVAKSGEQVIVIVDKDNTASSTPPGNFLVRWWDNFLSLFKRKTK